MCIVQYKKKKYYQQTYRHWDKPQKYLLGSSCLCFSRPQVNLRFDKIYKRLWAGVSQTPARVGGGVETQIKSIHIVKVIWF